MIKERELKVLELIAQGYSDAMISDETGIKRDNIRYIVGSLLHKLGAINKPNLIYKAFEKGILSNGCGGDKE